MDVEKISVTMNRRAAKDGVFAETNYFANPGNAPWVTPDDASVDLAALPFAPSQDYFDYKMISINMLATRDLLVQRGVAEGEPVFFSGFFYQFQGATRMEPIVRQGNNRDDASRPVSSRWESRATISRRRSRFRRQQRFSRFHQLGRTPRRWDALRPRLSIARSCKWGGF